MSQQVREWQVKLNILGAGLKIDGIMGPKTWDAIHGHIAGECIFDQFDAVLDGKIAAMDPGWHLGVDVSGWQSPSKIEWEEIEEDGYSFAIVKASQGTRVMGSFEEHVYRIRAQSDLRIGAYHFANLKGNGKFTARQQAEAFANAVKVEKITGPLVLDVEWAAYKTKEEREADMGVNYVSFPAASVRLWIYRFIETVRRLTGRACWIYTGASFFKYRIQEWPSLSVPLKLWIADYMDVADPEFSIDAIPREEIGGVLPLMRQFAGGKGRAIDGDGDGVTGYSGALDQNIYWGRLEDLV